MRRSREIASKLALLLAGLAAGLAAAEALARVLLPPPQRVLIKPLDDTEERLEEQRGEPLDAVEAHHPASILVETKAGRRLRASSRVLIENHVISGRRVELRINSIGYRNPEIGPKRGTRLLFLGDSITFADYLPEEETYVRVLERLARDRGHDWEAINAGITAIGTANELAILIETGIGLSPDTVVLGYFLNDHEVSPGVRVRPMPPWLERSRLASHANLAASYALAWAGLVRSPPVEQLRLGRLREQFLAANPPGPGDPRTSRRAFNGRIAKRWGNWGASWSPEIWERQRVLLREFQRLAERERFRLAFVVFPVEDQVEAEFLEDYPQRRFLEIARELKVPALDLLPAFREERRRAATPLFHDYCHHTGAGSRLIAERLLPFLEELP